MTELIEDLYGLLIPVRDERLLVPRSCVAEVLAWVEPAVMHGAPVWYLGTINWSGRAIPVISFEATMGAQLPSITGRTRIVVLRGLTDRLTAGAFGIITQGFPQLVRLTEEVVKADPRRAQSSDSPVLCGLRMVNETPVVPDFEFLENLIADETTLSAL